MTSSRSPWLARYALSIFLAALFVAIKIAVPFFGTEAPYTLLLFPAFLSAMYGGAGPGLLTLLLSSLSVWYFFLGKSPLSILPLNEESIRFAVFLIQGIAICLLSDAWRRSRSHNRTQDLLYQNLLQAQSDSGEAVLLLENGRVVFANEAASRISGYSIEELPTLEDLIGILTPDQQPLMRERLLRHKDDEQTEGFYQTACLHKSGQRIELDVASKMQRIGSTLHLVIIARDTTHQKLQEEIRRRSEAHYRLLVENVKDYAIFTLKKNGSIASWNEGAERILGFSEDEVIGKHFSCLFTPEDVLEGIPDEELRIAAENGRSDNERYHVTKDGQRFYASGVVTPLLNDKGILRGYIKVMQDITSRKQAEERIQHQALHDALTELPNRSLFSDRLERAISFAERNREQLAVMFLDLDQFKNINDTLGHQAGDLLLKEVARRLSLSVRKEDTVARLGGDEFTVLAPEIKNEEDALKIARKVSRRLRPPMVINGQSLHVTTSIGIALYPRDGGDVPTLLKKADSALYQAKESGRNIYMMYNESLDQQSAERLSLENSLQEGLDRGEFLLYYQPIRSLATDRYTGVEALIRWNHPVLGMVLPHTFINIAEERGMILALNEWVIKAACRQAVEWHKAGLEPIQISINISARQFSQANLVEKIVSIIRETGIPAKWLALEITETVAMHKIDLTIEKLRRLRELGISISIDDFGTGHSSLNYLKRLPVDVLKIDRSFVRDCTESPQDAAIIRAIVTMAHSLGLKVVAEGVETAGQRDYLASLDCDSVQGYLYSPPEPPEETLQLIRDNNQPKEPALA